MNTFFCIFAGCKIKALRAKTNTYIKTPVRGEEPIFVITGRPEDVSAAKREVVQAAEHFTQIRAARRISVSSSPSRSPTLNLTQEEKKITVMVRVPYRVVGLVVGPKGATIKRIQQMTSTYIVTPSREKEPCFEVKGTPENVERAKKEIESYITLRTGGSFDNLDSPLPDLDLARLPSSSADPFFTNYMQHSSRHFSESQQYISNQNTPSSFSFGNGGGGGGGVMDAKDNIGWYDSLYTSPPMSAPVYSSDSRVFDFNSAMTNIKPQPPSPTGSCASNSSDGTAVTSPKQSPRLFQRSMSLCHVCQERDVVAALVPCGHNLFCMPCAHQIALTRGSCPVCNTQVCTTLRIHTK